MKSSSTRRVLKSVVGPALGATLGALVASGCAKEEAKPAPTTTQPAAADPGPPPAAASDPDAKVEAATPVEPEKPAAEADAAPKEEAPKKAAPPPKPRKGAAAPAPDKPKKEAPKTSPSTEWYAGTFLDRDIRPMRPSRRGTDATVHALLTGLHDPALRPLS